MRSAVQQAEPGGPGIEAELSATLAHLRGVLRKITPSAAARELADIGVTLLELKAAVERGTAARELSEEWVAIGRQMERSEHPPRASAPRAGVVRKLRVLPG